MNNIFKNLFINKPIKMNFKNKLDFCVIISPYNVPTKNIIFVTHNGYDVIEKSLCLEPEYDFFRYILNQYGFKEIDYCTFESTEETKVPIEEVRAKLEGLGANYSKILEISILKEIKDLQEELRVPGNPYGLISDSNNNVRFQFINSEELEMKTKNKVPKIGEKITLHFYLFLQCNFFNENDCMLEILGDIYSKDNNNNRNFLQITKSEFVRIESKIPGVIVLQSVKNYGEFINEINFLHKGNFKFTKPDYNENGDMIKKTKEFTYNIMEIKKNINPIHKIVIEVNLNGHYDDMIYMSKKIKKELSLEQKKVIPLEPLVPEMLKLKKRFSEKMLTLADADEFEKASTIKKDIHFIEDKIKIIDALEEKNITRQEYFKSFCLNS